MYKISFYVPPEYADKVKEAMFAAGAGRIGSYDCCAWETLGTGQFRPLAGSNPFTGTHGKLEQLPELQVEMVCGDDCIDGAIAALIQAHPYECPAYGYWKICTGD